jgi:S1-C subfamily serine protease
MTRIAISPRHIAAVAAVLVTAGGAAAQGVNEATERAMKDAVARAALAVVKIETAGGLELVGGTASKFGDRPTMSLRKGVGPSTGLVVAADGYVVTSSFNLAHKPNSVFVTVPGRSQRYVAKVVNIDHSRMLTLLKVDATDLPVPAVYPKAEVVVGQWALALGRALDPNADHPPSLSAGIVSATDRIWGKMLQTDCKVSPVNYGGPLVAIDGRVFGVLVPASMRAEGETAGVEGYDSGIGFAVPLEDVLAKLPELKKHDLRRGLHGIITDTKDEYTSPPVVGAVQPDSAAARAGIHVGDKIVEIDGKPTPNVSAMEHAVGPKYEGDTISVKVIRGDKEMDFPKVTLLGTSPAFVAPFLGILPMRDDADAGVLVRFVYPKSPADSAGLKPGDRITGLELVKPPAKGDVKDAAALATILARLTPGTQVKFEVKRKEGDKSETLTVLLGTIPNEVPEKPPLPSSLGKAATGKPAPAPFLPKLPKGKGGGLLDVPEPKADPKKAPAPKADTKTETGLLWRTNEALGREYWVYVPDNYVPNVSHGLVIWFHPPGRGGKDAEQLVKLFADFCKDHHFILVGPKAQHPDGWVPGEVEQVMKDVRAALDTYTIDRNRVVAHGSGNGGQMAVYLGFTMRDLVRGVAVAGAPLGTAPRDTVPTQPLSFFLAWWDQDTQAKEITAGKAALDEKRFPVIGAPMKGAVQDYLDPKTLGELQRWLDSLDRI